MSLPVYLSVALVLALSITRQVTGTRERLMGGGEPESAQVYDNAHTFYLDDGYYHLAAANALNKSDIDKGLLELIKDHSSGNLGVENLKFDSNKWFYKVRTIEWFVGLQDRIALHIYDNSNDLDLATGPQVNQKLCGLLLDYELHMIDKHYQHLTNSSELSIFNIMQSYGSPSPGIASASFIFPGDYKSCVEHKLNVVKKELVQVDQDQSDYFFRQETKTNLSARQTITSMINKYIASLFGTGRMSPRDGDNNELIEKHVDELKLVSNRYCLAGLRYKQWKNSSFDRRNVILRTGTCLPEYCDSKSLNFFYDKIKHLIEVQMPDYYHGYYIENLYCLPDENSKFRDPFNYTDSKLFIVFNIIWFSATIMITLLTNNQIVDIGYCKNSKGHNEDGIKEQSGLVLKFLTSWDLIKNYRIALKGRESDTKKIESTNKKVNSKKGNDIKETSVRQVDFKVIEGIKVFGSVSTIIAHACTIMVVYGWNPIITNDLVSKSLIALVMVFCPIVVDVFFVITGMMTAHSLFKVPEENLKKTSFWLKFISYRYVRIVPMYLLVHWFSQSYFRFLGSGPFWDYGTSDTAWQKVCQNDNIWKIIFPMSNFKSVAAQCNHVGWYLSNDVQASLVTPFFILIFSKSTLIGYALTSLTVLAMIANHFRYYYMQPVLSRGALEISIMTLSQVTEDASAGYIEPQYRLVSYLIGIIAGHLLYSFEIGTIKKWPNWFISLSNISTWSLIFTFAILPDITNYVPANEQALAHLIGSVMSGVLHGVTSLVVAGFMLLLCTNQYPTLSRALSKKIYRTLSGASLTTLVIHIPLIYYHSNTMRSLPELSFHHMIATFFLQIIESLLLSIIVHILYELPLRRFFVKLLFTLGQNERCYRAKTEDNKEKLERKTN